MDSRRAGARWFERDDLQRAGRRAGGVARGGTASVAAGLGRGRGVGWVCKAQALPPAEHRMESIAAAYKKNRPSLATANKTFI